jgi:hypothetical protein
VYTVQDTTVRIGVPFVPNETEYRRAAIVDARNTRRLTGSPSAATDERPLDSEGVCALSASASQYRRRRDMSCDDNPLVTL